MMWFLILVPIVALLGWMVSKRISSARMSAISEKHRADSRIVSRGEFFDGSRHMPVAVSLTDAAIFYENADMEASLDRKWIQEVEYDNELSTGHPVGIGTVLRLRSTSQTFEFVLPQDAVAQWKTFLPAQRMTI